MLDVKLSYIEAVEYVYRNTVLERKAIEALLKTIYQIQLQREKGISLFNKGQVREVVEEASIDKSLYYHELKIPLDSLNRLVKSCNSEVPHIS